MLPLAALHFSRVLRRKRQNQQLPSPAEGGWANLIGLERSGIHGHDRLPIRKAIRQRVNRRAVRLGWPTHPQVQVVTARRIEQRHHERLLRTGQPKLRIGREIARERPHLKRIQCVQERPDLGLIDRRGQSLLGNPRPSLFFTNTKSFKVPSN